mgnify:CR=1 FL=1
MLYTDVVSLLCVHLLPRPQDLVEVLSTPGIWWTAKQADQRGALPDENGEYPLGYEETQPFE